MNTEYFHFTILGENPSYDGIAHSEFAEDKLLPLCWKESEFRQFEPANNCDGGGVGWPLPCYARDGGYGLMQITNPLPTMDAIWNWLANMAAGKNVLDLKETASDDLVRYWNQTLNPQPDPPIVLSGDNRLLDIWCRYRGGHYWKPVRKAGTDAEYELAKNLPDAKEGIEHADKIHVFKTTQPWHCE